MKHIGIAAVTAEGAALVYRRICAVAASRLGAHRHPEITLHAFSFSEHLDAGPDPHERWAALIRRSAEKLDAGGADFLICPSNTPHAVYARTAPDLPLPWLHIGDAVRASVEKRPAKRLLLLGTSFTVRSGIYDERFAGTGASLLRPSGVETAAVHEIITGELVKGLVTDATRAYFSKLIAKYEKEGVEAVILGCTELPLAISEEASRLPLIDSAAALAEAAVDYALAAPLAAAGRSTPADNAKRRG